MPQPIIPQLDADEYLRWEARQPSKFELHHGFAVAFAGGSIDHDCIAFNVRTALNRLFPAPCRSFGADVKVRVAADVFFYADAGVVCVEVDPRANFVDAPRVVAEVLSPSTRAYDIVEKRAAYRGLPSLQWYLIVHADIRRVEVDYRGLGGAWSTIVVDDDDVAMLGDRLLMLDDVYARSLLDREGAS
jgi:Uma2 family endonuclease